MNTLSAEHDISVNFHNNTSSFLGGRSPSEHLISIIFLISTIALFLARKFQSNKFSKSIDRNDSRIPTLPSLPWFGALHLLVWNMRDLVGFTRRLQSKYGSSFRTRVFGKNVVILNHAAYVKKLLSSSEDRCLKKPPLFYNTVFPNILTNAMVTTSNIPQWRHHREILNQAFTYSAVKKHLKVFCKHGMQLQNELNAENLDGKSIHTLLEMFMFKDIIEITVGSDVITEDEFYKFHHYYDRCISLLEYRVYRPWLVFINWLWNIHPQKRRLDNTIHDIKELYKTVINRHQESIAANKAVHPQSDVGHESIIHALVSAKLSDEDIFMEAIGVLVAGHDTVSASISFLLLCLAINQECQTKCREEIDRVMSSHSEYDQSALAELKYLELCIKESLRMGSVASVFAREISEPLILDKDLEIEANSTIVVSPLMIHQNPDVYPNPDVFQPKRFAPENMTGRSAYDFMAFSMGPRNCIGWKLAILQLKIYAASVLRHFEVFTDNTMEKVLKKRGTSFWLHKELEVKWKRRSNPL